MGPKSCVDPDKKRSNKEFVVYETALNPPL